MTSLPVPEKRLFLKILYIYPGLNEKLCSSILEKATSSISPVCIFLVTNNAFIALELVEFVNFDLIIIYENLHDFDSVSFTSIIRDLNMRLPILVLSEEKSEEEITNRNLMNLVNVQFLHFPFSPHDLCQSMINTLLKNDILVEYHMKKKPGRKRKIADPSMMPMMRDSGRMDGSGYEEASLQAPPPAHPFVPYKSLGHLPALPEKSSLTNFQRPPSMVPPSSIYSDCSSSSSDDDRSQFGDWKMPYMPPLVIDPFRTRTDSDLSMFDCFTPLSLFPTPRHKRPFVPSTVVPIISSIAEDSAAVTAYSPPVTRRARNNSLYCYTILPQSSTSPNAGSGCFGLSPSIKSQLKN
jgi:DNA-binding NarL/FixJ family response regulator